MGGSYYSKIMHYTSNNYENNNKLRHKTCGITNKFDFILAAIVCAIVEEQHSTVSNLQGLYRKTCFKQSKQRIMNHPLRIGNMKAPVPAKQLKLELKLTTGLIKKL